MIAIIAIIAGHATSAIGLQLCGRGGDGGQVSLFSQGDGGQVERKFLGLMISRSFSPYAFCRWQDGNRVRQYLSEVIPTALLTSSVKRLFRLTFTIKGGADWTHRRDQV